MKGTATTYAAFWPPSTEDDEFEPFVRQVHNVPQVHNC